MSLSRLEFAKHLCYLLRHGAHRERLAITADGYSKLSDILALRSSRSFAHMSADKVEQMVADNKQRRFHCFRDDDNQLWLRANSGHTLQNVAVDFEPLRNDAAGTYPTIVYVTHRDEWQKIATEGLTRGQWQYIHLHVESECCARKLPTDCQILIYIDIEKAIEDGVMFYRGGKDVVLCSGNRQGLLPPIYFKRVADLMSKKN